MLAERVQDWTKQWREEGREKGKEEGEAAVLQRLLTKRFGPLPDWALQRLTSASRAQLEAWSERIFDAANLEQFFA